MKQEDELQQLKERLEQVEHQLEKKTGSNKAVKTVLILILCIFLLLTTVGILQFISAG